MKRILTIALFVAALTLLLCCAVYAEGGAGIYSEEALPVTALDANGTAVAATDATIDGKAVKLYPDAVKLAVDVESNADYVLIVMQTGAWPPTAENIRYIDQKEGSGASFIVYPSTMVKGETYSIYAAETGATAPKLIATFLYNQPYTLGDVDDDQYVTATDALWVLQNAAGSRDFNATQTLAGDVDKDEYVTGTDALWILQNAAGTRTFS